jgi:hemin uptake protein HemP
MVDSHPAAAGPTPLPPPRPAAGQQDAGVALVDTAALFAGATEVRLLHRGQEYRLRITRQGKLILTK